MKRPVYVSYDPNFCILLGSSSPVTGYEAVVVIYVSHGKHSFSKSTTFVERSRS
jgi:hypothetical protein